MSGSPWLVARRSGRCRHDALVGARRRRPRGRSSRPSAGGFREPDSSDPRTSRDVRGQSAPRPMRAARTGRYVDQVEPADTRLDRLDALVPRRQPVGDRRRASAPSFTVVRPRRPVRRRATPKFDYRDRRRARACCSSLGVQPAVLLPPARARSRRCSSAPSSLVLARDRSTTRRTCSRRCSLVGAYTVGAYCAGAEAGDRRRARSSPGCSSSRSSASPTRRGANLVLERRVLRRGVLLRLDACGTAGSTSSSSRSAPPTLERERDEEAKRAVADERLRIAQELHDVVAHSMGVIAVQAGVGAHVIDTDPAEAKKSLEAISDDEPLDAHRDPPPARRAARRRARRRVPARARASPTSTGSSPTSTAPASPVDVHGRRRARRRAARRRPHRVPHRAGGAHQRVEARRARARRRVTVGYEPGALAPRDRRRRPRRQRPRRPTAGHGLSACASASACTAGRSRPGPRTGGGFRVVAELPYGERANDPGRGRRRPGARAQRLRRVAALGRRHRGRRRGRQRRGGRRARARASGPTSSSWTSACPRWTASRRPAGSSATRDRDPRADPHDVRPRRVRVRARCAPARAASCSRTRCPTSSSPRCASSPTARRCSRRRSPAA